MALLCVASGWSNNVFDIEETNDANDNQPKIVYHKKGEIVSDAHVIGDVIDKKSGEHLAYITIQLVGTTVGVMTDGTGHYFLKNVPAGNYTIQASAVGYRTVEKQLEVKDDRVAEVNFILTEDAIMMDNVVVTASRGETKRREASNVVNVITPKLFTSTNSVCMSQSLNFQPGVRVETNCQNCGFTQVRINGMDGPYTQILIDSRPIFSALAGVYGLEQIPSNMVDRIEVVRGGGSALYGSNAIAGTINIITKEPLNNSLSISNTTSMIGGESFDINNGVNAALVSDDMKYGVSLYGGNRQRQSYDANGDGFSEIGKINAQNLGFNAYYKMGLHSKLSFEYHGSHEFRRGGDQLDVPPHMSNVAEQIEHTINSAGIKYNWFTEDYKHNFSAYASTQYVDRNSYYGARKDPYAYGITNDLTTVAGMQYIYSMDKCLFMPAKFTIGTEVNFDKLHDESLLHNRDITQTVETYSAFAQNEWKNEKLTIVFGGRIDKHSLINQPIISPRLNFRYNPIKSLTLRTGYAMGFRAPQVFDEDLHIAAVGGENVFIENDPNLKPERSHCLNLSADYYYNFENGMQLNFLVDGFYTNLEDVFLLNDKGHDSNGNLLKVRENGSGSEVMGISFEGKIVPTDGLNFQFGTTLQSSKYKKAEQFSLDVAARREIFRSPNLYGYTTLNYNPFHALTISLSGTYTGSMWNEHYIYDGSGKLKGTEVETPDFFDMNIKVNYEFHIGGLSELHLNAGVMNVFNAYQSDFDKGANRDSGYIYGPSLPRSYFVGLTYNL